MRTTLIQMGITRLIRGASFAHASKESKTDSVKHSLAQILKSMMEARGLSARAVARGSGVPQATVSRLLNGKQPGEVRHLVKLADFFDCSLDELLGRKPASESLESIITEQIFSGWLKVKVERAIPTPRKEKK